MAHSLLWEVLSASDVAELNKLRVAEKVKPHLQQLFTSRVVPWLISDPSDPHRDEKNEILLDFFFHTLRFCSEAMFDAERTSTLFSIMYWTHKKSMDGKCTNTASFAIFQEYIVAHSVHRPPFSVAIFSLADIEAINHYVMETYYRNYKLYLYAFTPNDTLTLEAVYPVERVERVKPPRPLSEATPEEDWLRAAETERRAAEEALTQRLREEAEKAKATKAALPNKEDEAAAGGAAEGSLKAQLEYIKTQVTKLTAGKLDELEAKLTGIEDKLAADDGRATAKKPPLKKK